MPSTDILHFILGQMSNNVIYPASMNTERDTHKWYYPPSGVRRRYLFCKKCSTYKTTKHDTLKNHVKNCDPRSNPKEWHVGPSGRRIRYKFCCDKCSYKATQRIELEKHVKSSHSIPKAKVSRAGPTSAGAAAEFPLPTFQLQPNIIITNNLMNNFVVYAPHEVLNNKVATK